MAPLFSRRFEVHELPITQSVLEIALRHAQQAGAQRILRITMRVGELSGIVPDSIQFYFDFVSRETMAEGAKLVFNRLPGRFRCRDCNAEYEASRDDWLCPRCQGVQVDVLGGREFEVESIEVT